MTQVENGSLIQDYQPHQCSLVQRRLAMLVFITTTLVWISILLNRTQFQLIEQHKVKQQYNLGTMRYRSRRILAKKEEWKGWEDDDDDDDDEAMPFHLQDDDATRKYLDEDTDDDVTSVNNTTSKKSQTTNSANNEKKDTKKQQQQQNNIEDEGNIIFSENIGSKEKVIPKRPPPPPPPSTQENSNSNIRGADNQTKTDQDRTNELYKIDPNYTPTKELNQTRLPSSSSSSTTGGIIQHDNKIDEEADTIFDDLLRGFSFASLFCLSIFVLYKLCNYCCVRWGLFPDERVVEARLRRMRLKRKRSYRNNSNNNQDEHPPLDTRQWGEWMAKRGNIIERADGGNFYSSGGVWDAVDEDSSVWEDDVHFPSDDAGFIEFDNDINDNVNGNGILEMAVFPTNNGITDASLSPELEYGEGEELEDASHDGRLFDNVDDGKGVEQEADKFFKGKEVGKKKPGDIVQERTTTKKKKNGANDVAASDINKRSGTVSISRKIPLNKQTPQDVEQDNAVSDDTFFNALQSSPHHRPFGNDSNPSPAAKETVKEHGNDADLLGFDHNNTTEKHNNVGELDNDKQRRKNNHRRNQSSSSGGFTSSIVVEDKGYDEESDLLGLRSESPPPLDLEEMSRIEQKLNEDMKNAKLY